MFSDRYSMSEEEASDPVEGTSNPNAVNEAILSGIERLNDSIANLSGYHYPHHHMHADVDDADEYPENDTGPGISIETSDSASCVDIQKDLENIAGSSASVPADDVGEANVLDYSSQLDVDTDVKAPKINEKVAEVVNKLCLKRVSQEQSKAIIKRHNTPENVKTRLPKCEQSIWNQLPARTRVNDVKFQTTQAMLLASVNCQLEVAETLVKTKASKEVLTSCLDGLTLAMTANYELNQRRRDSIKPQFKFEFAKGLCSSTNPADEFLFGGDTAKRVKEIAELNKSRVCKGQTSSRGLGQRYSPYPSRGARSEFSRGRGRGFRGRFNYHSNYSSQQQHFQNAPQPDKRSGSKSAHNWYVCENELRTFICSQLPFRAGQTKNCIFEWQKITSDPETLDYVEHCHIEFVDDPCKYSVSGQRHFNIEQQAIITTEVEKLVQLGAVGRSKHEPGECISPIFVIPKSDGSYRLIFNFKSCNKAVLYRHFKMDTLHSILKMISQGDYMASLDLKHAYYTIPIAPEQRRFLKFLWLGELYAFKALPMGLSSSPRIFTKVMKAPLALLRQKGCTIAGYIDDFFLQGSDFQECVSNLREAIDLFLQLGFTLHPEKSVLLPSQTLIFLGFILDTVSMTVTLTQKKKDKLKSLCLEALNGEVFPIRFIAQVIGKIVSYLPGVEFGKLHYRNLERDKIQALVVSKGDYEGLMHLSESAKNELQWWLDNVMYASRRIQHSTSSYVFQTDASGSGWGAACTTDVSRQSQGVWSQEQRCLHINVRELYVVFICLTIFCNNMTGVQVRFELDNQTAVTYLNQMGGSKSKSCDTVARKIWDWSIQRDIWLSAVHIPGASNVIADTLSRKHYSDHEWMLNQDLFSKLCVLFPEFSIDLFATTLNCRLPRYASWRPDPHAAFVDAFSRSWQNEYFYAFPPFSLIARCLDKVEAEHAEGVLVVPAWATQTWYTRILRMVTQHPVVMLWPREQELLLHPSGPKAHTMQGQLKLMACPVSGNTTKSRAFQSTLPMFSSIHGDLLLRNSTQCILRNGLHSVVQGKLLHIARI